ncbi:MAG: hypothetical protein M3487_00595 [Actinomycetota bacterium]|nr:hypothetical protein [Actinomycetota bacterium]
MTATDDELVELLGAALRAAEPVPERVVHAARGAWTWRTIDEELAELVFDSALESSGVRSEDTARQLTFRAPGVEIEVMVVDGGGRRIVGQLVPPQEATVQLTTDGGVDEQLADGLGRFTFDSQGPGPVRLTVRTAGGDVSTEWVIL